MVWERGFASERRAAVAVWWEAITVIRRYPLAAFVPAVLLGALGQSTYYLEEGAAQCIGGGHSLLYRCLRVLSVRDGRG